MKKKHLKIKRQREAVDDETGHRRMKCKYNFFKNKEVSDSDRHATNYDDEWLTVNA